MKCRNVAALFVVALVISGAFSEFNRLQAAEPSLTNIVPTGFQRGQEISVTFSGARLADAQELLFYSPGLKVTGIESGKDNQVVAKIQVTPDCRLGIHAVRLRTASGVSNLMTFTVGSLPEVAEVEPNSDFAKPQAIPMNSTVSGIVQAEDIDNFEVELKKGERLVAELEGIRLGRTLFDPYLAILNSERFELVRSDDAPLLNQDSLCSIVAPEDGKYVIQVRETSFGGSGNSNYRLHIGNFPRPTAVYPAGAKPGETVTVRWIGDPFGDFTSQISIPNDANGNYGIFAQDGRGIAPSPNMIRVSSLSNALESEPNDELAQATVTGDAPIALNGIIEKNGDIDYFKFNAKKGEQYDIRVSARKDLRSPLDSVLSVTNEKGASLGSNDDSGGPDSYLRLNIGADGVYVVSVRDHLRKGGPNFVYRVEITPVQPSAVVQLPERVQYIPTTTTIAKGNRMALMVSAVRNNWGGDLLLEAKDLPAGVTYEAVPMPGNRNETIVLFNAANDANGGKLSYFAARPADEKLKIEDRFFQRTMLVRGNNNVDVWGHSADRTPIVVAEPIPFTLTVVQPKAPIVRNGSLDLKVIATRAPDFKAPIAVSLLYNPPGIGSSGSVSIPEGQNEAVIPVTCGSNAEMRSWRIAVVGRAPHGGASVEAATQLVDLTIADQFYNFTFEKTACEQGQETELVVKVEKKSDFEGEGKAELLGLPAETVSTPLSFNKNSEELVFKVKVNPTAKVGKYSQIVCRTTFQLNGEAVVTTLGNAELRIDEPIPVKSAPAGQAKASSTAAAAAKPAEAKRLSRLEQLRLEKEKAEKKQ